MSKIAATRLLQFDITSAFQALSFAFCFFFFFFVPTFPQSAFLLLAIFHISQNTF